MTSLQKKKPSCNAREEFVVERFENPICRDSAKKFPETGL